MSRVAVDSLACDTVMPAGMAEPNAVHVPRTPKLGHPYDAAIRSPIHTLRERLCLMSTEGREPNNVIHFQVADASKALPSITNTADIPESLLLDCIKFFLGQSSLRKEAQLCYLGLLLSRGFSDAVMADELRKVELSTVVKLLEVLNSLMHDPAGIKY